MTLIYREYLAAHHSAAAELVLLHGWASDSDIWRSVIPSLRQYFNITLIDLPGFGRSVDCVVENDIAVELDTLLEVLPESAIYCGWSLGGMFAAAIAEAHPHRVLALVTIASNAVFVANEAWPAAMPRKDFDAFCQTVEKSAVKGLRRFELLQLHGDERAAAVKTVLNRQQKRVNEFAMAKGLRSLNELDNRAALAGLTCPALHVFGGNDALVPRQAAECFAVNYPNHEVKVFPSCGHIPFLSQPEVFLAELVDFVSSKGFVGDASSYCLDKTNVGRSFSRAAVSYDGAALLQRRIADQLITLLPQPVEAAPLVDLGCGTGYSLPALREYGGARTMLAMDLAPGMLAYAKDRYLALSDAWICGDAEDLPLADGSVGLVFSSLALQWCENLAAVYAEIARVLKPGGSAVIATLGPNTLYELRQSWQQVDAYAHVNSFAQETELRSAIDHVGLQIEAWQEASEVMEYERLSELTRELKNIGAHNVNSGRPSGLTSRARIKALTTAYEHFRQENALLPATYQVWYLRCKKIA
ncbi:Malonyl-[acyl-carrier protein] O-methyltransferase [Zhongshania aliphaticivorans]|uniref:Malonyl-[acyl-carrier protein] O-methyltransferase n=1 Tax=Zhongshania aliphaticivorans TaxID=1470434 RepID=A0A5S9Q614_9GAMM|nr:malonyl-ACP O-methyltransferase BioC [Zhongshania aliphaticivorans]CAA0094414.1 Malonyl-[acyl-carrier protein] O-methyltransferase [Zhongshania aliphaticivorans]CAA0112466.1 Malonyl-[acyl-carrier protein] O-methyltransferase [Zhongshania aliphaticivorans]